MEGIDPRSVLNRISSTIIKKELNSINALDVLRSLKEGFDQHASISKERGEHYLTCISLALIEFDDLAKKEVQKAFVYSYEESAKTLMDNYLDNVESYCHKSKLKDPLTGEEMRPDELQLKKMNEVIARLIDEYGYNSVNANDLLRYVGSLLNR